MIEPSYHLLIVDDESEILSVYSEYFRKRGFAVDTASNGHEGLEKLRQADYDVAIVDIRMPGMDGITMSKTAISEGIDTEIIILTGHGEKEDAIAAINIGVSAWFEKHGIDMSTLRERVTDLAEGLPREEVARILSSISE